MPDLTETTTADARVPGGTDEGRAATALPPLRRAWPCLAGLLLLIVAVYGQVVQFAFVYYDDQHYVFENEWVRSGLSWEGLQWAFTTFHTANWHPLTWLSHMLDCTLFGVHPGPHHAVNVLFHAANSLLLLFFLARATGGWGRSFTVAVLFAIHPLHVESVAWISERKDVLSSFFFLLTLTAYLRCVRQPSHWRWTLVLLGFAAGLMSKPMVVTLPCVLLLLDYWPLGRMAPGTRVGSRAWWPAFAACCREKWPLFLMTLAGGVITYVAQASAGAIDKDGAPALLFRLTDAAANGGLYLIRTFVPWPLSAMHPRFGGELTLALAGALIVVVVSVAAVRFSGPLPCLTVGWFWYLGMLVPIAGLVQIGHQSFAERYSYLPQIGVLVILAWCGPELWRHLVARRWLREHALNDWRRPLLGLGVIALLAVAAMAHYQTRCWRDSRALFSNVIYTYPGHAFGYEALANALARQGQIPQARELFSQALAIRESARTRVTLGNLLCGQGELTDGVRELRRAVELEPSLTEARYALAVTLARQEHFAEALRELQTVLALDPGHARTHYYLALIHAACPEASLRSAEKALRHAREACRLTAYGNANPLDVLAMAHAEAGDYAQAAAVGRQALQLARTSGWQDLVAELRARLSLYVLAKPYRLEPTPAAAK